ncbi:hypothetical protein BASA81_009064 [Batrachochytrium salamandrivorans]|nr:hypothetical protein BASA81_009064 [Batrachochytrium salamandrivorans]
MADIKSDDYYKVLGAKRDSSLDEIKKLYKKLAIKYHPDKNPDNKEAEEAFKRVGEAYGVLSDKEKREEYDQYGKTGPGMGPGGMPGGGGGFHSGFGGMGGGGGGRGMSQEEARQMFSQMFGSDDPFAAFFGGMGGGRRGGGGFGGIPGGGGGGFGGMPSGGGGFGGMPGGGFGGGGFGGMPGGGFGGGGFGGMPQQQHQPAPKRSKPGQLAVGTQIQIKNLRNSPELNGEVGQVVGHDDATGRYLVQVDGDETFKLRRENLQQVLERVEITGLSSSPELNGKLGTLFDRNLESDRYNIRLNSGQNLSVKPSSAILPVGTSVSIVGLTNGVQYNGRQGTISEIDRAQKRYVVDLDSHAHPGVADHLRIKWDNVRA